MSTRWVRLLPAANPSWWSPDVSPLHTLPDLLEWHGPQRSLPLPLLFTAPSCKPSNRQPLSNVACTARQVALRPGDVVIMATDGLYDNMWDEEIVSVATTAMSQAAGAATAAAGAGGGGGFLPVPAAAAAAQQLAATLANTAFRHAQDPSFRSPWAVELANQPNVSTCAHT